ncbi:NADPH-dependent FMN reductase [Oerskovia flava]|uniref:NADPH-dependent FMN reductase n=1 Tax=Oerskovia flava TaxID=2986422 RepID=UPI00223FF220|nr:NADPH-dependent FMN reductase [Oerskovia sp. JB1-3-2]
MTAPAPSPDAPPTRSVVVLSGNPRAGSRTLRAAESLARRIADHLDVPDITTIDLAPLAHELYAASRPTADAALARLAGATVAVVATPVYKAAYTGLLKSFLDLYGPDALAGVVAVPLVVSGNPAHSLAAEVHLRPLLVELGASVPTRALAIVESQLPDLDRVVDGWLTSAGPALVRTVGSDVADAGARPALEVAGVAR